MQSQKRRNGGDRGRSAPSIGSSSKVLQFLKEQTRAAATHAKERVTEVAQGVFDGVQDEAEDFFDDQKGKVVSRVSRIGKVARQAAHALHAVNAGKAAEFLKGTSDRVSDVSGYLQEQSLTEMLEDTGEFLNRNRVLGGGALFIIGFAAVRFLKSTESRSSQNDVADKEDVHQEDDEENRSRSARRRLRKSR